MLAARDEAAGPTIRQPRQVPFPRRPLLHRSNRQGLESVQADSGVVFVGRRADQRNREGSRYKCWLRNW